MQFYAIFLHFFRFLPQSHNLENGRCNYLRPFLHCFIRERKCFYYFVAMNINFCQIWQIFANFGRFWLFFVFFFIFAGKWSRQRKIPHPGPYLSLRPSFWSISFSLFLIIYIFWLTNSIALVSACYRNWSFFVEEKRGWQSKTSTHQCGKLKSFCRPPPAGNVTIPHNPFPAFFPQPSWRPPISTPLNECPSRRALSPTGRTPGGAACSSPATGACIWCATSGWPSWPGRGPCGPQSLARAASPAPTGSQLSHRANLKWY